MTRLLTGGSFTRYTFAGACNEPKPNSWKNACRRRSGHPGQHHTWDPRTGIDKGRHPYPFRDEAGRPIPAVDVWPSVGGRYEMPMLRGHGAYVAPAATDREMVAVIRSLEPQLAGGPR